MSMQDFSKEAAVSVCDDAAAKFGFEGVIETIQADFQVGDNEEVDQNEDPTIELEAGVEITLPDNSTSTQPPEGSRARGITAAAFFIYATIFAHTANLEKVLLDLSTPPTTESINGNTCLQGERWSREYLVFHFLSCLKYSSFEAMVGSFYNETHTLCLPYAIMPDIKGAMMSEGINVTDIAECDLQVQKHNEKCCIPGVTVAIATTPSRDYSQIAVVYNNVFGLFGLISAVLIIRFGYRIVAVAGAVITAIGCLSASFVPHNVHLLSFLYGGLPAIGLNFLSVSTTVAILEYYRTKRMRALLFAQLGPVLAGLFYRIIQRFLFPILLLNVWRNILRFEAGSSALLALVSLCLRPLKLRMIDNCDDSLVSRMLGLSGFGLFKEPLLYIMAALFFFWKGAYDIPFVKLGTYGTTFIIIPVGLLLLIIAYLGNLIGTLIGCCLPRDMAIRNVFIVIIIMSTVTGSLNMSASQMHLPIFAIVYSGIFGIFTGIGIPCLKYTIPIAFGEDNIALSTGIMEFSFGLASIAILPLADAVQRHMGKIDAAFYLCGSLFFISSLLAVLSIAIHCRKNKIKAASKKSITLVETSKTESPEIQNTERRSNVTGTETTSPVKSVSDKELQNETSLRDLQMSTNL